MFTQPTQTFQNPTLPTYEETKLEQQSTVLGSIFSGGVTKPLLVGICVLLLTIPLTQQYMVQYIPGFSLDQSGVVTSVGCVVRAIIVALFALLLNAV